MDSLAAREDEPQLLGSNLAGGDSEPLGIFM